MSKSGTNLIYVLIAIGLILYTIGPYLLIVFGVIGIVALVLYVINRNKDNSTEQEKTFKIQQNSQKPVMDKRPNFISDNKSKNLIVDVETQCDGVLPLFDNDYDKLEEEFMNDVKVFISKVEGEEYSIPSPKSVETHQMDISFEKVPDWEHRYIYAAEEIEYANQKQKAFYAYFKKEFLKGNDIDICGNTNYAFVLMFELIKDAEKTLNVQLLQDQIDRLSLICPEIARYALPAIQRLIQKQLSSKSSKLDNQCVWINKGQVIEVSGLILKRGNFYLGNMFVVPKSLPSFTVNLSRNKLLYAGIVNPEFEAIEGLWISKSFYSYQNMSPAQRWYYLSWLAGNKPTAETPDPLLLYYLWGIQVRLFIDTSTILEEKRDIVQSLIELYDELGTYSTIKNYIHSVIDCAISVFFINDANEFGIDLSSYELYKQAYVRNVISGKTTLDGEDAYIIFNQLYKCDIPEMFREYVKEHVIKNFRKRKVAGPQNVYAGIRRLPIVSRSTPYIPESEFEISVFYEKSTLYDEYSFYQKLWQYRSELKVYNSIANVLSNPLAPLGYFALPKYIKDKEKHVLQSTKKILENILTEKKGIILSDDLLSLWGVDDHSEKTFPKKYLDNIIDGLRILGFDIIPNYQYGQKRLAYNELCVIHKVTINCDNEKFANVHTVELFLKLLAFMIYGNSISTADYDFVKQCIKYLDAPDEYNGYLNAFFTWLIQKKQSFDKKTKEEVLQLDDTIKKSFTTLLLKSVCITGEIDSKRVDTFKKIMPSLGLNPDEVHSMLHQLLTDNRNSAHQEAVRCDTAESIVHLDVKKLEEFKEQTSIAQDLLSGIFVIEDDTDTAESSSLDNSMLSILKKLLEREMWTKEEVQQICGPNVMIGNLLEQINDYAYEKVEDVVVDEDDDKIYIMTEYKDQLI